MMYRIEIDMDNAAFESCLELPRLLKALASECKAAGKPYERKIMDSNGNTVGKAEVIE